MANSWPICLAILAYLGSVICGDVPGYNVVSAEEFKDQAYKNVDSYLLRVAYFWNFDSVPAAPDGYVIRSFVKNYEEAGNYLKDFKINMMMVNCKEESAKEKEPICGKPNIASTVYVFKDDYVLDEMPMDILYNMDSIVANVLHLALLMDVPTLHTAMELASMKQRVIKAKKNLIFGKLMAIGTASDRAFMEGVFAYSDKYMFTMTTSRSENLLGTEDNTEWEEKDDRVWFFDCSHPIGLMCKASVYYGPMTVKNFAIYLKTLQLPDVWYLHCHPVHDIVEMSLSVQEPKDEMCEEGNFAEKLPKPLHEMLGLPVAYLITTEDVYDEQREVMMKVAKEYKGNLVFAMNKTEPGVVSHLCPRPPPCVSIKPPGQKSSCIGGDDGYTEEYGIHPKHPMGLSKPFSFINMDQLVRDWLDDYYFDPVRDLGEDYDKNMFGEDVPAAVDHHDYDDRYHEYDIEWDTPVDRYDHYDDPHDEYDIEGDTPVDRYLEYKENMVKPEQEKQDDAVALAVDQMKPLKLNLTDIPHLTDKTFDKHVRKFKISIITFTVKWDPRSLAFLHPYLQASKQIKETYNWDYSPLARVECSDWPDVCDKQNVTRFPTILVFERTKLLSIYRGSLDTDSIVKSYKLFKLDTPVMLNSALDLEYFKLGSKPVDELGELVSSVVVAVVPEVFSAEIEEVKNVAKALQGSQVVGLCTGLCTEDAQVAANAFLFVHRFDDKYREETHFKGDFTFNQMILFIEQNLMPVVPELTPASLPKLFYFGAPFMILFRLPGDEASDRIENVMAKLSEYETRVVMSWMDASPDSVGSRLLHDYKFPEINPPNLVFLDHSTGRVCNYPDVEMLEESELFGNLIQWMLELLKNEGSCNALLSGDFEPQVPSYDFLTRIKERRQTKEEQAEGSRGRFGPQTTKDESDEADDAEEDVQQRYEDEMFGMEDGEDDVKKPMQADKALHTEL